MNRYTKLYKITGGYTEYNKICYYSQQWKRKNRQLNTHDMPIELKVNVKVIKQVESTIVSRILGVYITLSLDQKK